ncbi:DUF5133 domain-containing protein [Streptomyces sp. NPDC005728]|uniref:DUF5133 domain-containing protein n=1 Tax=Streptomyces sp. NPDC005728 TaxID=3157054 RepID=UPI00341022B9
MRRPPGAVTVWRSVVDTGWTGIEAAMIMAVPSLLRELVERCETLRRRVAAGGSAEDVRRLEDATYTLCVITGTRQLDAALSVARRQMARAMSAAEPVRS